MDGSSPERKRIKVENGCPSNCEPNSKQMANGLTNSAKLSTLNSLGLEETKPVLEIKNKSSGSPSTSLKENISNGMAKVDTDALIEKFVSTLTALIKPGQEKIISRIHDLRKKCQEKYLNSKDFELRINSALENIRTDPRNVFVYIKELYDEMKLYRKKSPEIQNKTETETLTPESESSEANEKQIRVLEKMLKKLDRVIRKLKKKEVSLDEMDDNCSAYIYEDRVTKRFMQVWKKISELKKRSARVQNHVDRKFRYTESKYPELNSQVETFLNSSRVFPDYSDILQITKTVNENSSLGLSQPSVQILAQEVFLNVGREMKKRRVSDYQDLFGSYLTDDVEMEKDPADSDTSLRESLEQNYKEGQDKIQKVLSDFTEKQMTLKLEPKEVKDSDPTKDPDDCSDSDDEEDKAIEREQIEEEEEEAYSDEEIVDNNDKTHSADESIDSGDDRKNSGNAKSNSDDEHSSH